MSAQDLADACGELGVPIARSTLADLENGRRDRLSVHELLVLSAALQAPPVELATPLGRAERVEILPGIERPTWEAARWFRGDLVTAGHGGQLRFEPDDGARDDLAIFWFVVHDDMVMRCQVDLDVLRTLDHAPAQSSAEAADHLRDLRKRIGQNRREAEIDLGQHRAIMRCRGWLVPPLPPELPLAAAEEERYLDLLRQQAAESGRNEIGVRRSHADLEPLALWRARDTRTR